MSRFQTPFLLVSDSSETDSGLSPKTKKTQSLDRKRKPARPGPAGSLKKIKFKEARKGTILEAEYCVPKDSLSSSEITRTKQDLTLSILDYAAPKSNPAMVVEAFSETATYLRVPRFYGVEHFGPPETVSVSLGVPMNADVKCTFIPQESRRQPEALLFVKQAFQNALQWGGILALPCGWGKTGCAIKLAIDTIAELEGHSLRTLIVVRDTNLLKQWTDRIQHFAPLAKIGVLQQSRQEIEGSDFTVAMAQSLAKREYQNLDSFGCLILDEAHHMAAPVFSRILQKIKAKYRLSLTATPRRKTEVETQFLHWLLGPILFKPLRPENDALLVRMLWYTQTSGKDISTKGAHPRPLTHIMLQKMVDDLQRTRILADVIAEYYQNPLRNILVLSKRLSQLDNLAFWIQSGGVPEADIGFLKGDISTEEREINKTRRIVLAIEQLGKEGLDATHLNTLIVAMPIGDIEQATGRIQRIADEDEEWSGSSANAAVSPVVVYFVDPYSIYQGMAYKNQKQFKSFGYRVVREDLQQYQWKHLR